MISHLMCPFDGGVRCVGGVADSDAVRTCSDRMVDG